MAQWSNPAVFVNAGNYADGTVTVVSNIATKVFEETGEQHVIDGFLILSHTCPSAIHARDLLEKVEKTYMGMPAWTWPSNSKKSAEV